MPNHSVHECAQPCANRLLRRKNVMDLLPPVSTSDIHSLDLTGPLTPSITKPEMAVMGTAVSPRDPSLKTSIQCLRSVKCQERIPLQPYGTPSQQIIIGSKCDQPSIQPSHDVTSMDEGADLDATDLPVKVNTGRWTEAEHKLFLKGLETFPYRAWKKIATLIKTRTVVQIRTHAQKYYQKLEKEEAKLKEREQQLIHHPATYRGFDAALLDTSLHTKRKSSVRKRKCNVDDTCQLLKKCASDSKLTPQYEHNALDPEEQVLLDFHDKPIFEIEYPLQMDNGSDNGFSAMDNELLLSDDDHINWFTSETESATCESLASFAVGQYQFSPLYELDSDDTDISDSTIIDNFDVMEDDDFVLDPEKFLSTYLK